MALVTQRFDDGSTYTYDDGTGATVSVTDSTGAVVPNAGAGSPLVQQFANLFTYGVRAVIDARYPAQAAAPAAGVPLTQGGGVMQLAILAGLAYLAYTALAK